MKHCKITFALMLVGILSLLAACGGSGSSGNKVVVGTWGGDYQKFLEEFVNPKAEGTNVVFATADQASRMTKVKVEKGGDGTFDVIALADTDMRQMINGDLVKKLDYSKIPNAKHIKENLKNPYFIPHIYSASVVVYNEDHVKPAPDSWEVLWDPKYKGKIGICSLLYTSWVYAAASSEGLVGTDDWSGAFGKLEKLMELEPKVYSSQEELGQALRKGDVWLTVTYKARSVQWDDGSGEPLGSAVPKEGTYPTRFTAAIPKNAPHPEGAYKYLNAMLNPEAQAKFAKNMGYAPTVNNAKLSKEMLEKVGFSAEQEKRIKPVDLNFIAEHVPVWKQKFDKLLASQ